MKTCKLCSGEKTGNNNSYCIKCVAIKNKEYRQKNSEKLNQYDKYRYYNKPGRKPNKMVCPICQKEMWKPCIDHNHITGKVRGIICGHCNSGLGMLRDNPTILERALQWVLER
jgi:hypothetical protein